MSTSRVSTSKLLSLIIAISPVFGYSNSASNRPFARPFEVEEFPSVFTRRTTISRTKPTYDLGLGKNKPLYGKSTHMTDDITQHIIEHESVRPYPSPLDDDEASTQQGARKVLPKIQLKRNSKDELYIQNSSDEVVPHISNVSDEGQLDINTVWVEMMIHSEQMKVASITV